MLEIILARRAEEIYKAVSGLLVDLASVFLLDSEVLKAQYKKKHTTYEKCG